MTETQPFNAQKFKARCSAIHAVMANSRSNPQLTEKQAERLAILENKVVLTQPMQEEMAELLVKKENGKKVILSDTCISHLKEWYAWEIEGMVCLTREVMDIPQMQKGVCVEADSLDLLCQVDGIVYKENKLEDGTRPRISNEFLSGEIDAYFGTSAMEAEIVPDVKSQFDFPTFLGKIDDPITLANDWQLKGYGDITGAQKLFVANCLVDTPTHIVFDFHRMLMRKMNVVTDESPEFVEKWAILERSMNFSHIPAHKRVFKKAVDPLTENQRQALYDRVKVCREWLSNFHETYQKLNK